MAGSENQSNSSVNHEKPYGIVDIKAYVPLTLDLDHLNYDAWYELFTTHCISFGVLGHIDDTSTKNGTNVEEWTRLDNLVKLWIYGTINKSLLQTILKKNSTAHEVSVNLENLFHDNKESKEMQIENELRNISIGTLSLSVNISKRLKSVLICWLILGNLFLTKLWSLIQLMGLEADSKMSLPSFVTANRSRVLKKFNPCFC